MHSASSVAKNAFTIARAMKGTSASWEEIEIVLEAYKEGIDGSHGSKPFWT